MKLLCHVGPWSDQFLRAIAVGISSSHEFVSVGPHAKFDEANLCKIYMANVEHQKITDASRASEEEREIIARCRLLRALPENEALLHLTCMRDAVKTVFDNVKPDFLLSETVDSYVMDLLHREARHRGIPFVGLVNTFVNGYFRISAKGERVESRQPSESEVIDALKVVIDIDYKPNFIAESARKRRVSVLKRWARNSIKPIYFYCKRRISGEMYNYHYWMTEIVSKSWLHIFPKLSLGNPDWEEILKTSKNKIIYLPLQMFPEATIDYWCDDLDVINYETSLLKMINRYKNDFTFLVKEHPNVLGYRHPSLYGELCKQSNVLMCPTFVGSNYLFDHVDAVFVLTGTVGFEYALRGKPVLTACDPYYKCGRFILRIEETTSAQQILEFMQGAKESITYSEQTQMVRQLLSGLIPGKVVFDGSWCSDDPKSNIDANEIGRKIAAFLETSEKSLSA